MEQNRRHALIVIAAIIGLAAFAILMNIGLLWGGSSISADDDTVTCRDRANMSDTQRWEDADYMLARARDKADGGRSVPADSLVDKYVQAIDAQCRKGGKQAVDDVAVSVYLKQRATFRP